MMARLAEDKCIINGESLGMIRREGLNVMNMSVWSMSASRTCTDEAFIAERTLLSFDSENHFPKSLITPMSPNSKVTSGNTALPIRVRFSEQFSNMPGRVFNSMLKGMCFTFQMVGSCSGRYFELVKVVKNSAFATVQLTSNLLHSLVFGKIFLPKECF